MITKFRDEYAFLSNFYPSPIIVAGAPFPTVEHAFQSFKAKYPADAEKIRTAPTPRAAKRLGRTCPMIPNWDQLKRAVMLICVRAKFEQNSRLRERLLETGDVALIEGNTWGDTYWGQCNGVGQNELGKILMLVRRELR